MHVLTLTPFYPHASDNAAGCFVAEPLRALERCGVTSTVFAVRPVYRGRVRPHLQASRAEWVHYISLPGGLGLPSAGRFLHANLAARIRDLHRRQPVDLIHAHAALPCGQAAALLARELRIPCVVTVHGLDVFFTNQVAGAAGRWCQRASEFVYRSASRVICISRKVLESLVSSATSPVRARLVYNGVDTLTFSPSSPPIDESAPATILSVGNLIPIKDHQLLLRAVAKMRRDYPALSCDIIGDGPERSHLARMTENLGLASVVRFHGRQSRSQVANAMRRCTVFVLPSRYEGLGMVYLEAMATGKPVVACREQGIAEIIEHGKTGWLIDPGDVEGLVGALRFLLREREVGKRTGAAARHVVEQNFSLQAQAAQLAQVYRECVA